MAYQEFLNLVLNPEYGDITDVESGTDLVLKYGKPPGAQFPQTNLTPRRKSSGLTKTSEETTELLESIPDIEGSFDKKTFDEMQTILDNFMNVEDDSTGTSQYGGNAIDDALSDLDG